VTREKGEGGGWVVGRDSSQILGANVCHGSQVPTISARLLGRPASSEPYTILIMRPITHTILVTMHQSMNVWKTQFYIDRCLLRYTKRFDRKKNQKKIQFPKKMLYAALTLLERYSNATLTLL
jgi:hypothetical protein